MGVLQGFATLAAVIGVGFFLAHRRIVDADASKVLSTIAFNVASPALALTLIARTDVTQVLSRQLLAIVVGVLVPVAVYVAVARLVWQRGLGDTVIGAFAAAYVNGGNLGIPVAAYVLGNATYVVPTLLLQLVVLTPFGLMLLDHDAARRRGTGGIGWRRALVRPLTNPLTVAMIIGVVLSLTGTPVPAVVGAPLEVLAAMAVPSMLLSYGVALRLGGGFGSGGSRAEIALCSALQLVVQPLVATLTAAYLLGLEGHALFAVAIVSALPTAQNVFTHATRYGRGQLLARDTILVTTALCLPVMLVIAAVLG
nr:AEC family transporter [Nocardioides cavernaquae]